MYQLNELIATIYAELDILCICIVVMSGIVISLYYRSINKRVKPIILAIGICFVVAFLLDAVWVITEHLGRCSPTVAYIINAVYFILLALGAALWFMYICRRLQYGFAATRAFTVLTFLPVLVVSILAVTASFNHGLFYLNEEFKYDRGSAFLIFAVINYGYYALSVALSIPRFLDKKVSSDLHDQAYVGIIFPIPIFLLGIVFSSSEISAFCLSYTLSVIILFSAKMVQLGNYHRDSINASENPYAQQGELLSGLGENYEELLFADIYTGKEEVFKKSDRIRRAVNVSGGKSFSDKLRLFADGFVIENDRKFLVNELRMETLREVISSGRPYNVRFRTTYTGRLQWYEIVVMPSSDKNERNGIMLGLRNCDYEIKATNKTRNIIRKSEANKRFEEKYNIIQMISGNYLGLFYIDLKTRRCEVVSSSRVTARLLPEVVYSERDVAKAMLKYVLQLVHPDDRHLFSDIKSFNDLKDMVSNTKQYVIVYRRDIDGEYKYCEFVVAKQDDVDSPATSIAIGISEKDEFYREKAKSERYHAIISELSEDFEYVDYVATQDNKYMDSAEVFKTSDTIKKYVPGFEGTSNYHERLELLIKYVGYEPDIEKFRALTRREVILEHLEKDATYHVNTRFVINNRILYYQLKFASDKACDGSVKGFVVGARSVDDEIRKEMELREGIERIVDMQTDELKTKNRDLARNNEKIVEMLGSLVEGRDSDSGKHIQRTKNFTYLLAKKVMEMCPEYELTMSKVRLISLASPLHDVGKIAIPDSILKKPGKLTEEEFEIMKTHCVKGVEIIESMYDANDRDEYISICKDICRYHHEKWDGKGYPDGLKEDNIPVSAQIVSIADCFDALTSERVYKPAYSPDKAFDMIIDGKCGVFSDKLMKCFNECRNAFMECINSTVQFSIMDSEDDISSGKAKAFNGLKILVVDDDPLARQINSDILETEGGIIATAENGVEACHLIEEGEKFDIILMDLIMPKMSGTEAIQKIREIEKKKHVHTPIVAISAERTDKTVAECKMAGADDCLNKPLDVSQMSNAIISYMKDNSQAMEERLSTTIRNANTDPLTKTESYNAYTEKIAKLEKTMQEDPNLKFALIVCDVNNLKAVNDNYGHDVGDIYIKNCSRLLCSKFIGCHVYRVGGDEFVVLLQGDEYYNRNNLMAELFDIIETHSKIDRPESGRASIAAGIAEYDSSTDKTVAEVAKRADTAMYINKRSMKKKEALNTAL